MVKRQNREIRRNRQEHRDKVSEKPNTEKAGAQVEETDLLVLQRAVANPDRATPADIFALQHRYGNQAVQRLVAQRQTQKAMTYAQPITRQESGRGGRAPALIQRAVVDQVGPIKDWPTAGPFCTSAVWWWAAQEAAGGDLAMTEQLAARIPTQFATLMDLSDRTRKFLLFKGEPKKTNLQTNMPPNGTVLLWEGNGEMVDTGREHAAVVKGGKICGYNQGGISRGAGAGYTELDVADLHPVAESCYTISESKIVNEARTRIVNAK